VPWSFTIDTSTDNKEKTMDRITQERLQGAVSQLNYELGELRDTYKPYMVDGRYPANEGTFYINYAYGGARLCRIANSSGGEHDISHRGTKREVYDFIRGMLTGIHFNKQKELK